MALAGVSLAGLALAGMMRRRKTTTAV
jgi:MYXO-CTERM domain-containing protein